MEISLYHKSFDRSGFDCAVPALNNFLQKRLSQELKARSCACYILHDANEKQVLGYYTLSASKVATTYFEGIEKRLPRYSDVPVTLIGRLAICSSQQGKGLGGVLLADAIKRAYDNSEVIGACAIVVDAKDENAVTFYKRYGFRQFAEDRMKLCLMMKTAKQLLNP